MTVRPEPLVLHLCDLLGPASLGELSRWAIAIALLSAETPRRPDPGTMPFCLIERWSMTVDYDAGDVVLTVWVPEDMTPEQLTEVMVRQLRERLFKMAADVWPSGPEYRQGLPSADNIVAHEKRGGWWVIDQDGPCIRHIHVGGDHGGPEIYLGTEMLPASWADAKFAPIGPDGRWMRWLAPIGHVPAERSMLVDGATLTTET